MHITYAALLFCVFSSTIFASDLATSPLLERLRASTTLYLCSTEWIARILAHAERTEHTLYDATTQFGSPPTHFTITRSGDTVTIQSTMVAEKSIKAMDEENSENAQSILEKATLASRPNSCTTCSTTYSLKHNEQGTSMTKAKSCTITLSLEAFKVLMGR